MLIAQLTDTHVVDPTFDEELFVDNNARLAAAVAALGAEVPTPDLVLMTGDLVNNARPAEYELLAQLIAPLAVPVLAIPGNHDERNQFRSTFPDLPWADAQHASWVVDVEGLRVIGLDTTIPGDVGAEFDDARASWLAEALSGGPNRRVLAVHHPPFKSGIEWMDEAGFIGLDRLSALLAEHPVERVLCGHMHRPMQSTIAGIPAIVGISTVHHVDLDLAPEAPVSLVVDPSGYMLHAVTPQGWVTHTRYTEPASERIHPNWANQP